MPKSIKKMSFEQYMNEYGEDELEYGRYRKILYYYPKKADYIFSLLLYNVGELVGKKTIEEFLGAGLNLNSVKYPYLHYTCQHGLLKPMKALVYFGADVNKMVKKHTPLDLLLMNNNLKTIVSGIKILQGGGVSSSSPLKMSISKSLVPILPRYMERSEFMRRFLSGIKIRK